MFNIDLLLYWMIPVGVVVPLTAVLVVCVCGCRKNVPKNELLGLAGMVKITNPEENLNHNHQSDETTSCTVVGSGRLCADSVDRNKRVSTTANRSLPDLPVDTDRAAVGAGDVLWENGDTSSELYATVEENKHGPQSMMPLLVAEEASSTPDGTTSTENHVAGAYARLKSEHPYDRLRKSEHPYAQVGSIPDVPSVPADNRRDSLREEAIGGDIPGPSNPVPPPRMRKSVSHTSLDIPAATAIAGQVSANQDLPYMTPPLAATGPHFSGDSQDSKGYTSISVREPLANIRAQIRRVDSHYATVSDDSDEMYAAIDEPGSQSAIETYAQIVGPDGAPQPPSVDSLRQVAHSRQASSSSAASSVTNVGSPKPEKRPANSPLPPPPAELEEMYAKVMKRRREEAAATGPTLPTCEEPEPPAPPEQSPRLTSLDPGYEQLRLSGEPGTSRASPSSEPGYASVNSSGKCPHPPSHFDEEPNYESMSSEGQEPNYAIVSGASESDPNYEMVHHEDPNYESVNYFDLPSDPPYERLNEARDSDNDTASSSGYEKVSKQDNSVPGYGKVCRQSSISLGYEKVTRQSDTNSGYEKVKRHSDTSSDYEKVTNRVNTNFVGINITSDDDDDSSQNKNVSQGQHNTVMTGYNEVALNTSVVCDAETNRVDPGYEEIGRSKPTTSDTLLEALNFQFENRNGVNNVENLV